MSRATQRAKLARAMEAARRERELGGRSMPTRQETAYHEAAHAVMSEVLDFKVDFLTCEPRLIDGELNLGYFETVNKNETLLGYRVVTKAITLFAASACEWRRGTLPDGTMPDGDAREALKYTSTMADKDVEVDVVWGLIRALTESFLEIPEIWAAIEIVAKKLIAEGTLPGATVRATLAEATIPVLTEQEQLAGDFAKDGPEGVIPYYLKKFAKPGVTP